MARQLRNFNGMLFARWEEEPEEHHRVAQRPAVVVAHSVAHALRIFDAAGFKNITRHEMKNYWSSDCWPNRASMDIGDKPPHPGLWVWKDRHGLEPGFLIEFDASDVK